VDSRLLDLFSAFVEAMEEALVKIDKAIVSSPSGNPPI